MTAETAKPRESAGRSRTRTAAAATVSHNLNGQRLGRKGRDTRERIMAAMLDVLNESEDDSDISLSAVARRASLGMTSLYNYFNDLTELLLAVLEPIMATAEDAYISLLRDHWPDDQLGDRARAFVAAYHGFWVLHSRILHLRNSMADRQNERMTQHRVRTAQIVMRLIVQQMGGNLDRQESAVFGMASALMTGLERVVTVTTDRALQAMLHSSPAMNQDHLLRAEARLLELGIRDYRHATPE